VAAKGLASREAQPTGAARVDGHLLWPELRRRRPPEVAGPVAAERLERHELPSARPALESVAPSAATTALIKWQHRRACSFLAAGAAAG